MELSLELSPLKPSIGTVTDEKGDPIAGARVSTVNAAIAPPLGKLSELATGHLASDWSAITDATGTWKLQLPEGPVPLLFEAPGRGAEWRIRKESGSEPLAVPLSRGATLSVTPDREDANLILTLAQEESGATTSVPADKQPLVWARRVNGQVLSWSSLPPGVYGIYAKYPEPHYFMQAAIQLATVTLSKGEERELRVVLPPVRHAASSATLFLEGISRDDLGEELAAFGRDGDGLPRRVESFVEEVIGGGVVHLKAESARPPFHAMTKDHFFSAIPPLAEARQGADAEPWPAVVHPRADTHLQLRSGEESLQLPQSGLALLGGCHSDDGERVHAVTVPIEIRKSGFARFTAAAGCQSLVLELEPFEPVVANKVLQPGDQSLGEFVLRAAGSADVRVVREPGGTLVTGATVRIMARDEESSDPRPIVVAAKVTDETGWTQITGLPPYRELRVTAETLEGDKSDSVILRVEPRGRGLVDPLSVQEPATLIVDAKIDEAFLARFPNSRVATLFVRPADPNRESEQLQENTSDKPTRFGPLHPARWLVSGVALVDSTYSLFDLEDLEIKPGETRRVESTITPNVFEGIVTSEGKGVAAKVMIEGLHFNSDVSGNLRIVLEKKGVYRVSAARLSNQGNVVPIGDVAFTDPSRRIEINIPKGANVTARVRKGDRPIPDSIVWTSPRNAPGVADRGTRRGRDTNIAGEATFEDLSPGVWTFSVREKDGQGAAEESITVDSGESKTVELDLADVVAIQGTVRALGGSPLPRARVECLFVGPTGNPDRASANSDTEGKFSVALIAPPPPSALCWVIGPMGSVDAARMIPGDRSDLTVAGATAMLGIPNWSEARDPDRFWLVAPDGRAVSLSSVALKLGQSGSPLAIPALAAGRWKLVRVESLQQWLVLANGLGASLPGVTEITLRAGTTEMIQLDNVSTP